jgi:hypothetical protein
MIHPVMRFVAVDAASNFARNVPAGGIRRKTGRDLEQGGMLWAKQRKPAHPVAQDGPVTMEQSAIRR